MDNMLFCPFCGSPIVIPDQDDTRPSQIAAKSMPVEVETVSDPIPELTADENSDENKIGTEEIAPDEFVPLDFEQSEPERKQDDAAALTAEVSEILSEQLRQEPVRLQGMKPDLSPARQFGAPKIASSRKNADTFVPQRKFDPNDMFMDAVEDEEDYDYDDEDDDYDDYGEQDENGFWVRHIRGLVALLLLAVVAAVLVGWSFSNSGQQALARADLAWRPSVYAEIAYNAYQNGHYSQAGIYYSKASARDSANYDYASSAGVAYYMAQDLVNAETMARLAIRIDPKKISAYDILLRLYPDTSMRPLEIQNLLQNGYKLTGDSRLISAQ